MEGKRRGCLFAPTQCDAHGDQKFGPSPGAFHCRLRVRPLRVLRSRGAWGTLSAPSPRHTAADIPCVRGRGTVGNLQSTSVGSYPADVVISAHREAGEEGTPDQLHRSPPPMCRVSPAALAVLFAGLLSVGACSSPPTLQTTSLSQAPSVDGALSEWGGSLTQVGDRSVSMSAASADSLLYLAIVISDQALIRSVTKNGLVVWVDPTGTQSHTYGVRYPIGSRAQRQGRTAPQSSSSEPTSGSSRRQQLLSSNLAVVRNDTIRHRIPSGLSSTLEARATLNTGALIYELAIPVDRAQARRTSNAWKYGLHAPLGQSVSLGFEIPDPDDDATLFQNTSGVPSVTGGEGRRRPRGRAGQQGRRGRQGAPNPSPKRSRLDLWTTVVVTQQSQ